jgi:hypothetical protein
MAEVMLMGAAVRGVLEALLNRDTVLADFARREELGAINDRDFYPISLYVELCDYLEERLGTYAFLRVGRKMGAAVMDTAFPPDVKSIEDAIAQIDGAHHVFCKPLVGAFELVDRSPGRLTVRYTAPYNCVLQEGLFYEVAIRYGAPNASVTHASCRRKGDSACRFEIKY